MAQFNEPWYVFSRYGDLEIRTKDSDELIAVLVPSERGYARRIVQCVDACARLDTKTLDMIGAFGGLSRDIAVKVVLEDNAALVKQRDDLATALRKYQAAGFGNSTDFAKQGEAYDAAVEALANVKG